MALIERFRLALELLGERPGLLTCVAVLISSLFVPYDGFIHDAALYGGQVLNRIEDGALQDDLFFQYGSQDNYSAFSYLIAPFAKLVGLPIAFAVGYFLSITIFAFGAVRLNRELFSDPAIAAAGAIAMVLIPQHYGGRLIFTMPEPFLTPRLTACGFGLLGLAFSLRDRWLTSGACLFAALALHPLMAFGPAVMAVGAAILRHLGWVPGFLIAGLGVFGLTVVVAHEPWGFSLFGKMDPEWKHLVYRMTGYNFPGTWYPLDWIKLCCGGATTLLAAFVLRDRPVPSTFFASVFVVGLLGLLSTVAAAELPYALLFQGQGYRAVWVWQMLWIPALLGIAAASWHRGPLTQFAITLLILASFELHLPDPMRTAFAIGIFPLVAVAFRGVDPQPLTPGWAWKAAVTAEIVIFLVWNTLVLLHAPENFRTMGRDLDWVKIFTVTLRLVGIITRILLTGLILVAILDLIRNRPWTLALGSLLAAIGIEASLVTIGEAPSLRPRTVPLENDLRFVGNIVREDRARTGRRPTVFWYHGVGLSIWELWYQVGAKAYFHQGQVCGVMFSPLTAKESARRADRTARLTIDELRQDQDLSNAEYLSDSQVIFGGKLSDPEPTERDLRKIAEDPILDYIVTRRNFPQLEPVTNGKWYVYDARKLRATQPVSPARAR